MVLALDARWSLDNKQLVFLCPGPLALQHARNCSAVRFIPGIRVKALKEDTEACTMALELLIAEVARGFPEQAKQKHLSLPQFSGQ